MSYAIDISDDIPAKEGYIPVDRDLRIYYRQAGDGSHTVLVPDSGWLSEDFDPLLEGRTFIFCHMRGRGASDPVPDASYLPLDHEAHDLEAVRQHLGIERMALIGWSALGGSVAVYALDHPERVERMVLMCSVAPFGKAESRYSSPPEMRAKGESRMDPAAIAHLDELIEQGFDLTNPKEYCLEHQRAYLPRQMHDPTALAHRKSNPCRYPNEWPRNFIKHIMAHPAPFDWDWRSRLAHLTAPTLVIHGLEDLIPVEYSQQWVDSLPDARLLTIPNAGHYPHLEAPDIFFPAVSRFLAGEWPDERPFL